MKIGRFLFMIDNVIKIKLIPRCERDVFRQDNRFAKTNSIWCDRKFNNPFNVGQTMSLVQGCKTRDYWNLKYVQSGQKRLGILETKPVGIREANQAYRQFIESGTFPEGSVYELNAQYGRTIEELGFLAVLFREACAKEGITLTLEESLASIVIRVVDDTWNGYERELDILNSISKFTNLTARHSSVNEDSRYAVDGILLKNDLPICGIQIKPMSYRAETPYLKKAKEINKQKNDAFKENYGVPVLYAYYDTKDGFVNKYEFLYFVSQLKEGKEIGLPF